MRESGRPIFVGGIGHGVDDNEVRSWFEPYGEIVTFKVIRKQGAVGCAFVSFESEADGPVLLNWLTLQLFRVVLHFMRDTAQ